MTCLSITQRKFLVFLSTQKHKNVILFSKIINILRRFEMNDV